MERGEREYMTRMEEVALIKVKIKERKRVGELVRQAGRYRNGRKYGNEK